jgi:two-component sensor histidine kinase
MSNFKSREERSDDLKRSKEIIEDLKATLTVNEDLNREHIENERFLSQTAIELVEMPFESDIYQFTADKMKILFDDAIIMVTAYDEQSDLFGLAALEGLNQKWVDRLKKILGRNFLDSKVSFEELDKDYQEWFFTRDFFKGGLYDITGALFPRTACELVEKSLGLKETYSISLIWEGKLYGTVAIFLKSKGALEKEDTVKILVNMVAVALQRKKAEEQIKKTLKEKEKHIENERFLSQTAIELVELPYESDIYEFTAKKMKGLFYDAVILVTAYDEQSDLFGLAALEGLNQKWMHRLKKLLGGDYLDSKVSFEELDEKAQNWFSTRDFFHGGLYDVTGRIFPKKACALIENAVGLVETYSISLIWEEKLYGTVAILSKSSGVLEKEYAVKTLVNMVAVALQRRKAEEQIKQSLKEKDLLMKEVHHRVKNNLMVISSLLSLQSRYITDKNSRELFQDCQDRTKTMALIHERLYRSTDLKHIDFGEYIQTLATDLFHSYVHTRLIKLNLDVEEIMLDINTVVPLGLILNELISNGLKYAFSDGRNGEITVSFFKEDDFYQLKVADDGVGFPQDLDFKNTDSLGLQLVISLTRQIQGDIEMIRNNGTEFKLTFKDLSI